MARLEGAAGGWRGEARMSPLFKNTYREILRSPGRFLAILAIIVLGSGFFVGLRVSQKAMTATANTYLDKTGFYDFSAANTLGFTDEDVEAMGGDPHVLDAEGSFQVDALVNFGENIDSVYAFYTLPERINVPELLEGRLPQGPGECLADSWSGKRPGDKIYLSDTNDPDTLALFTVRELTVTGVCTSPLYLNFERGSTSLGAGSVASFCYVLPEAVDADYYTTVYLRCPDMPDAYTGAYDRQSEALEEPLTALAEARAQARFERVKGDAEAELRDAEKEYEDGLADYERERADAEQELADAWAELQDAQKELEDGKRELEDGRAELENGKKELTDNEKTLRDAKRELDSSKAQLDDAKRQLDEGWEAYDQGVSQLEESRSQGQQELDDADLQLYYAKIRLNRGEAEYSDNLALYEEGRRQYDSGLSQYSAGAAELDRAEASYQAGMSQLEAGKQQLLESLNNPFVLSGLRLNGINYDSAEALYQDLLYGGPDPQVLVLLDTYAGMLGTGMSVTDAVAAIRDGERQLSAARQDIDAGRAELAASWSTLQASAAQLDEAKAQLDAGRAELDQGWTEYRDGLAAYEENLALFNDSIAEGEQELSEANDDLLDAQAAYDEGLAAYEDGLKSYNDGLRQWNDGKTELEQAEIDLADAQRKYDDGLKEYNDGLAEYKDARAEADREFADAEAELADARRELDDARAEIDDIDYPDTFLLGRWANVGYACFESDASIVRSISAVFPVFFFLVAALICITTVSRMVEEQRSQLGVLMALGYSRFKVMGKFLSYAGLATVVGCVSGILLGSRLIPLVVWQAYKIMYSFSDKIEFFFDPVLSGVTFLLYLAAMLAVTWLSCRKELSDVPANIIRPKAPKAGKRVLLERVPFIWNRLSFLWKVTVRNIFRYKSRVFMMILGIAGCTALMITGMGINDSIKNVVDYQFTEISLYDFTVTFSEHLDTARREAFLEEAAGVADDALYLHQSSFTASANRTEKEVYLNAVASDSLERIGEFIDFHRGTTPLPFPGPGEALINNGLARALGVKAGDALELRDDETSMTVTVSGVYDNYIYNNIYISSDTYAAHTGGEPDINYALVLKDEGVTTGEALAAILGMDDVLTASASEDLRARIGNMMASLIYIVLLTIVCAAALAFVVIYNLTNINIQERLRELATVKVLGFFDLESALYVLRENLLLTVLGAAAGVPLGLALNAYVMGQIKIDLIHFTPRVLPMSYVYSIALTFLFSILVDGLMFLRLKKINPAEALKAAE